MRARQISSHGSRGNGAVSTPDQATETPGIRGIGSATLSGVSGQARTGVSDVTSGRLSLAALEVIAVVLIGFYVWTRNVQGGG